VLVFIAKHVIRMVLGDGRFRGSRGFAFWGGQCGATLRVAGFSVQDIHTGDDDVFSSDQSQRESLGVAAVRSDVAATGIVSSADRGPHAKGAAG